MNCTILTEGVTDAAILRCLIAPPIVTDPVTIVSAGGRSSAMSLARSYLITRSDSVALVVDADTTDRGRINELKSDLDALLHMVAPSTRSRVFMAVPSIEMIFFHDPAVAVEFWGSLFDAEQRVRSEFQPKVVLENLLAKQGKRLTASEIDSLVRDFGLDSLRRVPLISDLIAFVRSPAVAAVA